MAKTVKDYRYHVYADYGKGMHLAAWYDDKKKADKEVKFLKGKGYLAEVRENKEG